MAALNDLIAKVFSFVCGLTSKFLLFDLRFLLPGCCF